MEIVNGAVVSVVCEPLLGNLVFELRAFTECEQCLVATTPRALFGNF